MNNDRRYFHTLDALRFFAFLLVFFTHLPLPAEWSWLGHHGGSGVRFFFTLSGFLITYILVTELRRSNNTNRTLNYFFARRVLRIWPLYFACLLFAALTPFILQAIGLGSSSEGYSPNWWMSVFFLENYQMMLTGSYPDVSPLRVTWSICIEEHFYLLWTLAFGVLGWRRSPSILALALLVPLIARPLYAFLLGWPFLDLFTTFDYFAWGGLLAWTLVSNPKLIDKLVDFPRWVKFAWVLLCLFLLWRFDNNLGVINELLAPLFLAPAFAVLIAFTLPAKNRLFIGDTNWLSRWGKYTYGLYLLHTVVINLLLRLLPKFGLDVQAQWPVLMVLSFVLSLLAAYLSFQLLEQPFLRLKKHFRFSQET